MEGHLPCPQGVRPEKSQFGTTSHTNKQGAWHSLKLFKPPRGKYVKLWCCSSFQVLFAAPRPPLSRVHAPRVVNALLHSDESQRELFAVLPERVQTIIGTGLANLAAPLSEDDSLAVLSACIEIGQSRAELAKGKTAVMVIGNTGAGKSTFVNYMLNCTLEKVLLAGGKKVYVVSDTSPIKEVMPIGHSKTSCSFMPELAEAIDMNAIVVDCPGFIDNRGAEISIANAANIKAVMAMANGVTLVLVLNYHSLKADRGRGQLELLKILEDLFGSIDRAMNYASSMILVVSHVPLYLDEDRTELKDIKQEFDSRELSPEKARLLGDLLERACIFHPENLGGESWITAGPLSERIKAAPPITDPANVFKVVLSSSDEAKLRSWMEALLKRFQMALGASDNESAAKALSDMRGLNFLDHIVVTRLLENAKTDVSQALQRRIYEAQTHVTLDKTEDAAEIVVASRAIVEAFSASHAARDMLDLVEFSSRIDAIEAAIECRRAEKARNLKEQREREESERKMRDAIAAAEAGKAAAEAKAAEDAKKHYEESRQAEAKRAEQDAKPKHRCGHAYCGKRFNTGPLELTSFACSPCSTGRNGVVTAEDAVSTTAVAAGGSVAALLLPFTTGVFALANAPNAYGYMVNGKCCKCRGFKD